MNRKVFFIVVFVLVLALGVEYIVLTGVAKQTANQTPAAQAPLDQPLVEQTPVQLSATPATQIPIPGSLPFELPVSMGNLGPRLVAAGVIDLERFIQLYDSVGSPLTAEEQALLRNGSNSNLVVERSNAHFLLNLFWALGLANNNRILTKGQMVTVSEGQIERFASTGGWTIGTRGITELYASQDLISLTSEQQLHLEHVAHKVFRPCCNNPTDFPDCNHGMAMLGLLELLAASDATEDEMFSAARAMNAVWFPAQSTEIALYAKYALNTSWDDADPQDLVGSEVASGSGFQNVHQWLFANNLLPTIPAGGNGCGL
ncbi:MAG: hypothetical protein P1S60_09895 [Anaerolineae bacterium]|nr:hypothetical protein [Anaerolineae bacterium]